MAERLASSTVKENPTSTSHHADRISTSGKSEIEAYLRTVEEEFLVLAQEDVSEEETPSSFPVPTDYQSALTTFESPLMEYIRNLREKVPSIPKELSFISSIYSLTRGEVINILDDEQGEAVKQHLFNILYPLARNTKDGKTSTASQPQNQERKQDGIEREIQQILNRCYLVIFSNFSQMQAAIIQGIIYDIERQGVHLPIQSAHDLPTITRQFQPIVQNQAIIIRNMFRHLFPQYIPPDNIHILELCFLGLLEQIQHNFHEFLQRDEQLLQMLSRIKVAQDEFLNVSDQNLANILVKMERIQNQFHDIYNQRWRDGVLNDIIATFFYHARFIAYLENKTKITQKRKYFLASLEHLLSNYEDFYQETLLPQIELLTAEYNIIDDNGYTFVKNNIAPGSMRDLFKHVLDEDKFAVLSEMIITGDFSYEIPPDHADYDNTLQYIEDLQKMHKELSQKHKENKQFITYVNRLWDVLDNLHELIISELFIKWKELLSTVLRTYCQELFWFHAYFSTYTVEAVPEDQQFFQQLDAFMTPYREALELFSGNILQRLEFLSQQVYAFRDRAGDFNLLYTGILEIDLSNEEKQFQFEIYTPKPVKQLAHRLVAIQEQYLQSLQRGSHVTSKMDALDIQEGEKNQRLYAEEIMKTASYLAEERGLIIYCGSRKLFTGPQFEPEDFEHLYSEILDIYGHTIHRLQMESLDSLDTIIELKSLREHAQFEVVYEHYTEVIKYKALRKAWQLSRKNRVNV